MTPTKHKPSEKRKDNQGSQDPFEKYKTMEDSIKTLKSQIEKLDVENKSWKLREEQLEGQLTKSQNDSHSKEEKISQLVQDSLRITSENDEMKRIIEQRDKSIVELKIDSGKLKQKLSDHDKKHNQDIEELLKVKRELKSLQEYREVSINDHTNLNQTVELPQEKLGPNSTPLSKIQADAVLPTRRTVEMTHITDIPERQNKQAIDYLSLTSFIGNYEHMANEFLEKMASVKLVVERVHRLESRVSAQRKSLIDYENKQNKINNELSRYQKQTENIQGELAVLRAAHNKIMKENEEFQNKIAHANEIHEQLNSQIENLKNQLSDVKKITSVDLSKGLAPILTKLSSLAGLEPKGVEGLEARGIYEILLELIGNFTGEFPKRIPEKSLLVDKNVKNPEIYLDPDQIPWELLLKLYNWEPDHPFESLPEGSRRRKFRVLNWGWKVGDEILERARISPINIENSDQEAKNDTIDS